MKNSIGIEIKSNRAWREEADELREQLTTVTKERDELKTWLEDQVCEAKDFAYKLEGKTVELATVTNERDELVADAKRYRYIKNEMADREGWLDVCRWDTVQWQSYRYAAELDADIDAALAKLGADKTGEKTPQVDVHWPNIRMDISEGVCGTCELGAKNCDVDLDGHCGGVK